MWKRKCQHPDGGGQQQDEEARDRPRRKSKQRRQSDHGGIHAGDVQPDLEEIQRW